MKYFDMEKSDIAWCPGCGNYAIISILKKALEELNLKPENVVLVSGIGQAAKLPQYVKSNFFNGLHGRSLPPATAIKASNPDLNVIVTSGDGDMYGEGGNHFIHTIRRNPNITVIVHDNMVYGLTKGQASPTSQKGMKTPVQTTGVVLEPFNPLAVAISLDASFVARASVNNMEQAKDIIKKAILHKGFSLVDIFQPCVTFNDINTYDWYKDHTYNLDEGYDPSDKKIAFSKAIETEKMPLGILYINNKRTFEESLGVYETNSDSLFKRSLDKEKLRDLIGKRDSYNVRILEINRETSDTVTVTVTKPSGFQYRSGQYVMIGIGRTVNGKKNIPITFASSPTEDKLRFTIKNYGGYSNDLINSRIGDSWIISKPMGEAYNFDESHTENLVFLSAGSGITPFISIMRYIRSKGMNNKIIMLNGNCKYEDIIYRTELDFLSKDNIYIMNTLEKFDDSWRGEKGRITKDMILKYVNSERLNDYAWMICGPPLMVNSLEKDLKSLGVKDVRRDKWEIPGRCER